jgi:hypothetical protein
VDAIDRRGGAILFTNGVRAGGISQRVNIRRTNVLRKHVGRRTPICKRMIDDRVGRVRQDAFRQWFWLGKQCPRPKTQRESVIGSRPYCLRRQHIQHGEPLDAIRMIERHPIRYAAPTIVARDAETAVSKLRHETDQIVRDRSL